MDWREESCVVDFCNNGKCYCSRRVGKENWQSTSHCEYPGRLCSVKLYTKDENWGNWLLKLYVSLFLRGYSCGPLIYTELMWKSRNWSLSTETPFKKENVQQPNFTKTTKVKKSKRGKWIRLGRNIQQVRRKCRRVSTIGFWGRTTLMRNFSTVSASAENLSTVRIWSWSIFKKNFNAF